MSKRSYNQYCGLAVALDLLGERWTLLVVRNLLTGPKRFKDLENGLPGIGTGLLTDRLKQLQTAGIVERAVLPPPAASAVYQLTADGQALREPVLALIRWGLQRLQAPGPDTYIDADLMVLALEARFDTAKSVGADGVYELRIGASPFRVQSRDGALAIQAGHADAPDGTVTTDARTLANLDAGRLPIRDALGSGRLAVDGDLERVLRIAQAFGLT
jgi:DNA-binding HxlR family transcriptional regulator